MMAYEFNGTTQYLSSLSFPLGNRPTSYTLCCFVNGASQTSKFIISAGNSTNNNPAIALCTNASSARLFARSNNTSGSGEINLIGGTAFDNTWHHIAGTWDNTTAKLFVDGVEEGSGGSMGSPQDLDRFAVGAFLRGSASSFFSGKIANVALYNTNLSQAEILSLSKGLSPDKVKLQNLVFYGPLVRELIDKRERLSMTNIGEATIANHPMTL